jgi:two-component system, cell cycle response regulator DivK
MSQMIQDFENVQSLPVPLTDLPLVLVVDDVVHGRALCAEYLELRGFRVVTAGDGLGAVDMALALRPDVILMDLSMPVIDGWEATRLLKKNARTRSIPVVIMTAHDLESDLEKAREAGGASVFVKPMLPAALEAELRRQIAGAAPLQL